MKHTVHLPSFESTKQAVKSATRTLAIFSMVSFVALPSHAQVTAQDFEHERHTRAINECESRSGYYWSGTFENGRCAREDSRQNSGGGGILGPFLVITGIGICTLFGCFDTEN